MSFEENIRTGFHIWIWLILWLIPLAIVSFVVYIFGIIFIQDNLIPFIVFIILYIIGYFIFYLWIVGWSARKVLKQ